MPIQALYATAMATSLPVNPERLYIPNPNFDNVPRDPTTLFQRQSCAAEIGLSMPVLTSGLNNPALAPPSFKFPRANAKKVSQKLRLESCSGSTLARKSFFKTDKDRHHCNTITPLRLTAPTTTSSALTTRVGEQLTVSSQVFTIPVVTSSKHREISEARLTVERRGTASFLQPIRANGTIYRLNDDNCTSSTKPYVSTLHRLCQLLTKPHACHGNSYWSKPSER